MNNKDKLNEELMKILCEGNEQLFEMANIHTMDTGLKGMLYATYNGKNEGYKHSARVKVRLNDGTLFSIKLEPVEPINSKGEYNKLSKNDKNIVDEAAQYIQNNIDLFLQHWNGEITDKQLLNSLPHI